MKRRMMMGSKYKGIYFPASSSYGFGIRVNINGKQWGALKAYEEAWVPAYPGDVLTFYGAGIGASVTIDGVKYNCSCKTSNPFTVTRKDHVVNNVNQSMSACE